MFKEYFNKGFVLIPESNGVPLKGISTSDLHNKKTQAQPEEWDKLKGVGVGLLCGEISQVVCLDFDDATDEEIERGIKALGDSPCKKFGSKGISLFYRYNGEANTLFNKDGRLICELISTGKKTTIPPSKHRTTGKEYIWKGTSLIDATLPTLPSDFKEKLDSLYNISRKSLTAYTPPPSYDDYARPELNDAANVISYISPDDYYTWIYIGAGLYREFGDSAFTIWDSWSAKSQKYNCNESWAKWRRDIPDFRNIGYGTVIHYAKEAGYRVPERSPHNQSISVLDPEDYTKLKLAERTRKIEEAAQLHPVITNAPPIIRAMTQWIYETAIFPQPMLSLGAAISTIGFLMGRDYACAKSGIKANLYNICIAGSQEGKEHIKSKCQQVMNEFELLKNYQTSWTSGAAIEYAMEKTDGQVYYITDEMGIMMQSLVGKYTSANQQEAVSLLLRIYTEQYYKGKGYAKSADKEPYECANPFISICGFTQREPFFEAMTSMQAFTGVLNRMCLFKSPDVRPERNVNYDYESSKKLPADLKRSLQDLSESIDYLKKGKKHTSVTKYVPYTEGAQHLLTAYNAKIDERFRESQLDGENMHLIIGRSGEVLEKLALIGSGGKVITEEILIWAQQVVEYSTGIMCESAGQIVDNEYQRKKFKFVEFLEKRGGFASLTDINNNFPFGSRQEKLGIIEDLKEAGRIVPEKNGRSSIYRVIRDS